VSDTHQAIYDAVRSRISNGNIGDAVSDAARNAFDISHAVNVVTQEFTAAGWEMQRPCVLHKPTIMRDGNAWIACLGPDIAVGVVGTGMTPADAMTDFDRAFYGKPKTEAAS